MNILKTIMIATIAGYRNTRVVASPEATILTQEGFLLYNFFEIWLQPKCDTPMSFGAK